LISEAVAGLNCDYSLLRKVHPGSFRVKKNAFLQVNRKIISFIFFKFVCLSVTIFRLNFPEVDFEDPGSQQDAAVGRSGNSQIEFMENLKPFISTVKDFFLVLLHGDA
jgi:hypothetical protein